MQQHTKQTGWDELDAATSLWEKSIYRATTFTAKCKPRWGVHTENNT